MLHGLKLPEITERCLTEVVRVQIALLSCAVAATDIAAAQLGLKEKDFAGELDRWPGLEGRGQELVKWVAGGEKRYALLKDFATQNSLTDVEESRKEQDRKQDWCRRLAGEVDALLNKKLPALAVKDFFIDDDAPGAAVPGWKNAARDFLLYFYDTYLKENTNFPGILFRDRSTIFGRQGFLNAFIKKNEQLEICAFCDQGRYYSHKDGKVYAQIDHYLPKSRYPHFACHPFNLVPICQGCNSSQKSDKDPFSFNTEGQRCLSKHCLPYHSNLREAVYLHVDLSGLQTIVDVSELDRPKKVIQLGPLLPRGDVTEIPQDALQEAIYVLKELHGIPDRWADAHQSNRIRGTLFRRMRHFLGRSQYVAPESDVPTQIYNSLNILLYYLAQEDQQNDPFAFVMTWMLVALMNEYTLYLQQEGLSDQQLSRLPAPLIDEIVSWYGFSLEKNTERAEVAKRLLEIPRGAIDSMGKKEDK